MDTSVPVPSVTVRTVWVSVPLCRIPIHPTRPTRQIANIASIILIVLPIKPPLIFSFNLRITFLHNLTKIDTVCQLVIQKLLSCHANKKYRLSQKDNRYFYRTRKFLPSRAHFFIHLFLLLFFSFVTINFRLYFFKQRFRFEAASLSHHIQGSNPPHGGKDNRIFQFRVSGRQGDEPFF